MRPLHRCAVSAAAVATALGAVAAPAAAHPAHPFVMPELSPHRRLGAEVLVGSLDVPFHVTVIALEPTLSLTLTPRWTLTGRIPIGHVASDVRDGTTLGNATIGAIYLFSSRGRRHDLRRGALDFSLSFPTAADGGDAGFAARTHAVFRVPDPGLYFPKTTTVRVHGNYRADVGQVFFQGQFGMHVLVIQRADDLLLLRLGLAGGVHVSPQVALIAELTTMSDILDDRQTREDFLHTLDLGMRFSGATSTFGARLYYPLDDSLRNGLHIIGVGFDFQAAF
jgi:hypothetical protein